MAIPIAHSSAITLYNNIIPNVWPPKNITHRQKIDSALSLGLTVQPYVVVVGNINGEDSSMQYFTIIDDVQFLLENLLKAIDLCFKLFHVLNLKYSPQAQQVWNFFEHYFFDISDQKKGRTFLSIQSLCKDLEVS